MKNSARELGAPLRAGVIGIGWAGQAHMEAYQAMDGVELVAIAGMEEEVRAKLGESFGLKRLYGPWQEMIADGELDVISVAVPTFLHAPIAVAALEAGIHVLSEKPMARTAEEALSMAEAARRAGRVLEVAFNHRRRGDVTVLKQAIDAGELGRPYHARAFWMRREGIPSLGSWFTNQEMSGGGPLIDIGVHVLDYALHLLGEPEVHSVSAVTHSELGVRGLGGSDWAARQNVNSAYEVEDLASALIRFDNGASLILETSWAAYRASGDEFGITLYGTDGGAEMRVVDYETDVPVKIFSGEGKELADHELTPVANGNHQAVVETFIAHVRDQGSWAEHDGSIGLKRAVIIDACYASATSGSEVLMDQQGSVK
ncbi:putative dehydrogenase [Psychromicrobium silvestre]|uniref:Putative dehydrogenase n=1 Tax=Psychromicrobium silvestre TaxID=1645614 RepID=A0A7Y9LSF6_9MICC|nr:Gfo/Idh/MocA family oxidoreductase [Psychromicrobium silvestre]NYE94753.1 putative dehydrogenase [Psychromicrobium silvestre]